MALAFSTGRAAARRAWRDEHIPPVVEFFDEGVSSPLGMDRCRWRDPGLLDKALFAPGEEQA